MESRGRRHRATGKTRAAPAGRTSAQARETSRCSPRAPLLARALRRAPAAPLVSVSRLALRSALRPGSEQHQVPARSLLRHKSTLIGLTRAGRRNLTRIWAKDPWVAIGAVSFRNSPLLATVSGITSAVGSAAGTGTATAVGAARAAATGAAAGRAPQRLSAPPRRPQRVSLPGPEPQPASPAIRTLRSPARPGPVQPPV